MNALIDSILTNDNLDPAFRRGVSDAELRMSAYVKLLRCFDWAYESIDDGRTYRTAKAALEVLRQEQQAIDPTGAIWLSIMPKARSEAGPTPPLPRVA